MRGLQGVDKSFGVELGIEIGALVDVGVALVAKERSWTQVRWPTKRKWG